MFGISKYQVLELTIFIVLAYHLRSLYEHNVPGAMRILTKAPTA